MEEARRRRGANCCQFGIKENWPAWLWNWYGVYRLEVDGIHYGIIRFFVVYQMHTAKGL